MRAKELKLKIMRLLREEFLKSGKTYQQVADDLGVSRQWVYMVLSEQALREAEKDGSPLKLETLEYFLEYFGFDWEFDFKYTKPLKGGKS